MPVSYYHNSDTFESDNSRRLLLCEASKTMCMWGPEPSKTITSITAMLHPPQNKHFSWFKLQMTLLVASTHQSKIGIKEFYQPRT